MVQARQDLPEDLTTVAEINARFYAGCEQAGITPPVGYAGPPPTVAERVRAAVDAYGAATFALRQVCNRERPLMSIPVRPGYDGDLVISDALDHMNDLVLILTSPEISAAIAAGADALRTSELMAASMGRSVARDEAATHAALLEGMVAR